MQLTHLAVASCSLTRDQTQTPCILSTESQPLDHRGSSCLRLSRTPSPSCTHMASGAREVDASLHSKFPWWLSDEQSPATAGDEGDRGSIPGILWTWQPTRGFAPEEFHGQRSLAAVLRGGRELDTTVSTGRSGLQPRVYGAAM